MSSLSSVQGASPFFFLPWILLSFVLAGSLHVEAKGIPPPLGTYLPRQLACSGRTVYVGIFSRSPGLILGVSVALRGLIVPEPITVCRGIVYSGQTWIRSSPPVISSTEIICSKNRAWWFPRKMPASDHHPQELLQVRNGSNWQQITNAK